MRNMNFIRDIRTSDKDIDLRKYATEISLIKEFFANPRSIDDIDIFFSSNDIFENYSPLREFFNEDQQVISLSDDRKLPFNGRPPKKYFKVSFERVEDSSDILFSLREFDIIELNPKR